MKGHYNTFLQEVFNEEKIFGDEGQATAMEKNLGRYNFRPNFSFKSATERTRYQGMFHRRQKQSADKEWKFHCPFCRLPIEFCIAAIPAEPTSNRAQNVIVQEIRQYNCRRSLLNAKAIKPSLIGMLRQVKTVFILIYQCDDLHKSQKV